VLDTHDVAVTGLREGHERVEVAKKNACVVGGGGGGDRGGIFAGLVGGAKQRLWEARREETKKQ